MRPGRKRGKRLGGKAPRQPMRWSATPRRPRNIPRGTLIVVAIGVAVIALVAGAGLMLDRQVRGGILAQRAEALQRPDWVDIDALPAYVPRAFLAVVDPRMLARTRGRAPAEGRTLARDLVQQVHLLPSSLAGESRARLMSPVLEKRLADTAMVELYLNRIYLGRSEGDSVYGVFHAAREFFGKEPTELTLGEAATLAGLLLEPRIEDARASVGAVGARRAEVLRVMRMLGLIDDDAFRQAGAERLGVQPGLEQMPMSRPAGWGTPASPIRLPPESRPVPVDSLQNR